MTNPLICSKLMGVTTDVVQRCACWTRHRTGLLDCSCYDDQHIWIGVALFPAKLGYTLSNIRRARLGVFRATKSRNLAHPSLQHSVEGVDCWVGRVGVGSMEIRGSVRALSVLPSYFKYQYISISCQILVLDSFFCQIWTVICHILVFWPIFVDFCYIHIPAICVKNHS